MQVKRQQYLAKNTALFALNSIGTKLITFLLVPLYTVAFTTEEYGMIDLVSVITTIFIPIITLNIGEAVMRFALDEETDDNHIMSIALFFAGFSLLIGTSVIFILSYFPAITINKIVIYMYCVSQGIYQTFSCNLRGQEKLFAYACGNILNTFLTAVLNILFLIVLKVGINGYFYSYIILFTVSSIYCFCKGNVINAIKNYYLDKKLLLSMVKYSIVLVPNSLMWWIMNSLDHIMITSMLGAAANGIYAISYKLPSILSALSTVFNQAWSYSAIHENKSNDREEFNNNMYEKLVSFQLLITMLLLVVLKPFLKIYVQPEYYDAWKYAPYLLVGNFFLTMGTFLSTFYTVYKDSKGFLFSGMVGAFTNIILNKLLIPLFGIQGAAAATCISYIAVFIYRVLDTKKYMDIHVFKLNYIIGYLFLIGTAYTLLLQTNISQVLFLVEVGMIILLNRKSIIDFVKLIKTIARK